MKYINTNTQILYSNAHTNPHTHIHMFNHAPPGPVVPRSLSGAVCGRQAHLSASISGCPLSHCPLSVSAESATPSAGHTHQSVSVGEREREAYLSEVGIQLLEMILFPLTLLLHTSPKSHHHTLSQLTLSHPLNSHYHTLSQLTLYL